MGAADIDGMSIDDFPTWAKAGNWKRIMTELRSEQYQPSLGRFFRKTPKIFSFLKIKK